MTQVRDRERKGPLDSYYEARRNQGIMQAGRYAGFDTLSGVSGLNFELSHAGSAHKNFTRDTFIATTNLGIWKTVQGITVTEDAAVTGLTCLTNASNAFERIDAVVGVHQYSDTVTGGVAATYSVIQGATGGPVAPALTADDQVLLGYIYIPASASTLASATWVPADVKGLGGTSVALKNAINRFTAQQQLNMYATPIELIETTLPSAGRTRQLLPLPIPFTANTYLVDAELGTPIDKIYGIPAAPIGTLLFLVGDNSTITFKPAALNSAEIAAGYQPLENYLGDAADVSFPYNSTVMLQSIYSPLASMNVWRILFVQANDQFRIKTLEDAVTLLGSTKVALRSVATITKTSLSTSLTGTFKYWRDSANNVWIWGQWQVTTQTWTQQAAGTMPVGYRPGEAIYGSGLSSNLQDARGSWKVLNTGALSVNGENKAIGTVFEFLICYPAEG